MAYTIQFRLTTLQTYNAFFASNTSGLVWRQASVQGMVADNNGAATVPQQAVPLAEVDPTNRPGKFTLTIPNTLPPDDYTVGITQQAGGSPAPSDPLASQDTAFEWNGANRGWSAPPHMGKAQSGSASTIQLASAASPLDGAYVGLAVQPAGGEPQVIQSYAGSTRTATVASPWVLVQPVAGTPYLIRPVPAGLPNTDLETV